MKTYWDYTEKERAAFTEETVTSLLDVELMSKGILKVVAPTPLPIKDVHLESETYFEAAGIVFKTAEQAQRFLELKPLRVDHDYQGGGYNYKYAVPASDVSITQVQLYRYEDIVNLRTVLAANKTAKEANEKAASAYAMAATEQDKVLSGVWEDWHACQSLVFNHQRVLCTFEEYKAMSNGDEAIAFGFLQKVFTVQQIHAAFAWFGRFLPSSGEDVPQKKDEAGVTA